MEFVEEASEAWLEIETCSGTPYQTNLEVLSKLDPIVSHTKKAFQLMDSSGYFLLKMDAKMDERGWIG